ncbi:LEA type 2 family protein [Bdellovibrio sp. HCB337]|uniref:LEA type 2 family protein n=1 Tax=Bdellovibrio sp. HCB337 TaxID=3394358 RepID=UPI0039A4F140
MKKIFLVLPILLLCSCASFWGTVVEKPKISLDRVSVKDVSLKGSTLIFHVNVENPNKMDLKVDQISYKVFVNNKELTKAQTDKAVTVPAQGASLVELPLPIEYNKIFTDLKELMFAESAKYKIEGDAKFPLFTIPFTKEGDVKLR